MSSVKKRRIFLGIPVSGEVYLALRRYLVLSPELLAAGRYTTLKNAHITLRFLGDVDENQLSLIRDKIISALSNQNVSPIDLQVTHIDYFPPEKKHLIAAMIAQNDQLELLFEEMSRVLSDFNVKEKRASFKPHITLYRFSKLLQNDICAIPVRDIAFTVNTLVLYESRPTENGSEYIPLSDYSLSPKRD